jgi:hypothetical protein
MKIKISQSPSQAFSTYHPNVFSFTLSLSEGRPGTAWKPSNNKIFFLPPARNKASLAYRQNFLFASTFLLSSLCLILPLSSALNI